MKRILDYMCLLAGLFLFGPLTLLIALAIALWDGPPIFFRQTRLGKEEKPITVLKFRTMQEGKVTRVGRILRPCGLDEVPQLWNVWKGQMNIVGPRPLTKEDVERLKWGENKERWNVAPGLTGLAQIHVGHSARRSLCLDRYYARHASVGLDIRIILISLLMNFFGKRRIQRLLFRQRGSRKSA